MRRAAWVALTAAMLLAGCGGPTTERTVGADGRSTGVSTFTTPYTPRDSVSRAVTVLKRLQLQSETEGGFLGFGGSDWAIKSDYYSASAHARTVSGEKVDLAATWEAEGKSQMKVSSTLNDAQHRNLVEQIVAGMK